MLRRLAFAALSLACVVIVLGAYVRLSDAGLGCPDWPGCYGRISPGHAADEIAAASMRAPDGPVSMPKAWKEMVHRYLAASLGLLILVIAVISWRRRRQATPWLAIALVAVVIFQGLLGKWTVTLLLKPAIVSGHLIGGLCIAALLACLWLREARVPTILVTAGLVRSARIGIVLLGLQIVLGGWVSTNYAALGCSDLPGCHGSWLPEMDFRNAFHVFRPLGMTSSGELLSLSALTAIHWTHRAGALLAGSWLLIFGVVLMRDRRCRELGSRLLAALSLQIGLGIANVAFSLPLPLAVAHNAGALLLLLVMVRINYGLRSPGQPPVAERSLHEKLVA